MTRKILDWIAGLNHINHAMMTVLLMLLSVWVIWLPWYCLPAVPPIYYFFSHERAQINELDRAREGRYTPKAYLKSLKIWQWSKDSRWGFYSSLIAAIVFTPILKLIIETIIEF